MCMFFSSTGCADGRDIELPCDIANGEWTVVENEQIHLRFKDGKFWNGAYWGDTIQVIETFSYHCNCDTMFLTNDQTGFKYWLTFWSVGDTAAILNGQYYGRLVHLKRIN